MRFELLLERISPKLRGITFRLRGYNCYFNEDDLYQEAMLHLWLDFQDGKLGDKTDSYILQGCFFHLKNYIRTHCEKKRFVSLPDRVEEGGDAAQFEKYFISAPQESPAHLAHCKLLIEAINNNGLTGREKEAFNLALEGLTTREIGTRLGLSHVRVVKLLASARKKCRTHLDEEMRGYQN